MEPLEKRLMLARHYLGIGQPQRALNLLDEPGDQDLEAPSFHFLRSCALYQLQRTQEAAEVAHTGLSFEPENISLLTVLGQAYARLGKLAEAERATLQALRQEPEEPKLLCLYAQLTAQAGQVEKAERLLAEAMRLAPEDPLVASMGVRLAHLRGDAAALKQESQKLLELDPENLLGRAMLGHSLVTQGRISEAQQHFRAAAQLHPSGAEVAEAARESRLAAHWLLYPLRPIFRFGVVPVWIGAIAIIYGLRALGQTTAATAFAIGYLSFCVYSWLAPPLLRRWLWRRSL